MYDGFDIAVKNLVGTNLGPLHIRYIIYKQTTQPGQVPDLVVDRFAGSNDLTKLTADEEKIISSPKISLVQVAASLHASSSNAPPRISAQKLTGIWVRVYDEAENLLQEWALAPSILKSEHWDFPAPAETGPEVGAMVGAQKSNPPSPPGGTRGRPSGNTRVAAVATATTTGTALSVISRKASFSPLRVVGM